jgi:hypothetical protein
MIGMAVAIAVIAAIVLGVAMQSMAALESQQQRLDLVKEKNFIAQEAQQCYEDFTCSLIDDKTHCFETIYTLNKISESGIDKIQGMIEYEKEYCQDLED